MNNKGNLNKEQQEAVRLALSGHSVCITGNAGTGKSHTLKRIIRGLKEANQRFQVTSSTGIAGSQFDKCCTIHSFVGILDGRYRMEVHAERMQKNDVSCQKAIQRIQAIDTLVMTEVGMLSERTFKMVEMSCRIFDDVWRASTYS